jgi:hypothetical protein
MKGQLSVPTNFRHKGADEIRAMFEGDNEIPMTQYTLDEVRSMTFAELGAVEDPMDLMATTSVAPMLVRYVVRTGQLDSRYPGIALPPLMDAILAAASIIPWQLDTVGQKAPRATRDSDVDAYLDSLKPHLEDAINSN